jgi:mannose-6-phosphate isomerase
MPSTPPLSLAASIGALDRHYHDTIVGLWLSTGWNVALNLPYEALSGATGLPLEAKRYRAMACARQLLIFSYVGLPGSVAGTHADQLFGSLQDYFCDGRGGWIYSVDATGQPSDSTRDLYTYAFVTYACAEYHRRSGSTAALRLMKQTVEVIEKFFADGNGLYVSVLGEDYSDIGAGVLQNPIMHLIEAYLAAYKIEGDDWYKQRLREIGKAVLTRFVDQVNGCVAELPMGEAGNRIEPGHQFEWFSMVIGTPEVFADLELQVALHRAFDFACRHGVMNTTHGVVAAIAADGTVLDDRQRIWAQTEFARALAVEGSSQSLEILTQWEKHYRERFLHSGGWYEVLGATDELLRKDMPSTTPYHIQSAYEALRAFV